ncbi:MAG: TlpA disulfide reductase family protein [Candidatus Omnitrophota bacterium]
MKSKLSKFFVLTVALFLVGACSKSGAMEVGEVAPDFTINDAEGKPVTLSEFKGKVIILDFFASWCPPCRMEIPDFIALQKTYASQGFTMVGVSLVDKNETAKFVSQQNINYPVAVDDGKASDSYGPIRSIPTTFLIDKDFKIAKVFIGYRAKDVFEKEIQELLK